MTQDREHIMSDDCWCEPTRADWNEELQRWVAKLDAASEK